MNYQETDFATTIATTLATTQLLKKLKSLPQPFDSFSCFLKQFNAVVAGSFLFSCIGIDVKANDIDIFFGSMDAVDFLKNLGWEYVPRDRHLCSYVFSAGIDHEFSMKHPMCPDLLLNYIVYKNAPTQMDIQKKIDENFDLNGCTLQWNGDDWHVASDVNWEKLTREKVLTYRESQLHLRLSELKKISDNDSVTFGTRGWKELREKVLNCIPDIILERLDKYEKRGFTILNREYVRKIVDFKTNN